MIGDASQPSRGVCSAARLAPTTAAPRTTSFLLWEGTDKKCHYLEACTSICARTPRDSASVRRLAARSDRATNSALGEAHGVLQASPLWLHTQQR